MWPNVAVWEHESNAQCHHRKDAKTPSCAKKYNFFDRLKSFGTFEISDAESAGHRQTN
jgi:hypothetical protein